MDEEIGVAETPRVVAERPGGAGDTRVEEHHGLRGTHHSR
jgi:hypothetical protein